ncbi:MAG: maleylacetoacetate isomerase [Gammaproteobacteria bacterium]
MVELYGYWRSSASYRVRIALALKGIAYVTHPVHLLRDGGEQHQAAYRALNPQGRVPLLVDGDFRLNQSLAILDYLEVRHPEPRLVPREPQLRARMWAFCHTIAADIQPLQNTGCLQQLTERFGADAAARTEWMRYWIERGLAVLEQGYAAEAGDETVLAPGLSLADVLLVPQLYAAERVGADANLYPRLAAIGERLRRRPAFITAHPDAQPDAQS